MARRVVEKVKGVYEHPAGSGVWWINYYAQGQRHRENAGRRSDAIALYEKRKADSRRKLKLPELVPGNVVTFAHLSTMAVEHAQTHLKTSRDYVTRDEILSKPFGARRADSITPQEIDQWLTKHCGTNATANRYRSYISLAYRLGMVNGKCESQPGASGQIAEGEITPDTAILPARNTTRCWASLPVTTQNRLNRS